MAGIEMSFDQIAQELFDMCVSDPNETLKSACVGLDEDRVLMLVYDPDDPERMHAGVRWQETGKLLTYRQLCEGVDFDYDRAGYPGLDLDDPATWSFEAQEGLPVVKALADLIHLNWNLAEARETGGCPEVVSETFAMGYCNGEGGTSLYFDPLSTALN